VHLDNIVWMFRFVARKPVLGLEITASSVRFAAVSGKWPKIAVEQIQTVDLPAGLVTESYALPNVHHASEFVNLLSKYLDGASKVYRRSALSLPDGVFRVQTLEWNEFPAKPSDQQQIIRWRLEKTAAFDLDETVLRYQILRQEGKGCSVLVCLAKQAVIAQFEQVLLQLGLEPWTVGIASFHVLNFYFPLMMQRSTAFAIALLNDDSFTTMVTDRGAIKFYRHKEIKRGSAEETQDRFIREIEDSLHFYAHMDRTKTSEVRHLYLVGASMGPYDLAEVLRTATELNVAVLSPADVIPLPVQSGTASKWHTTMAAALGAGSLL